MSPAPDQKPRDGAAQAVDVVAVLLIVLSVLVFFSLIHLVLLPFVFAAAVAFVLTPLVDWIAKTLRAPRTAIALAVVFVLAAVVGIAAYFALPALADEALRVLANLQVFIERPLQSLMGDRQIQILGQPESAAEIAATAVGSLRAALQRSGVVPALLGLAFGGVFGFFLTLTLLAYFLIGGRQLVNGILWLFPPGWRPLTARVAGALRPILLRYFTGIAAVIVYAGVAAYLGLGLFLKLRHAAFLAAATGLLEVVPVVGPALSALIAGSVAVQEAKSVWNIIAYVIYASALRLSIDQLVGPAVLGSAARVHPTVVIFCFLAGGALFGIVGVILAVPFALTVKVALAAVYDEPLGDQDDKRPSPGN